LSAFYWDCYRKHKEIKSVHNPGTRGRVDCERNTRSVLSPISQVLHIFDNQSSASMLENASFFGKSANLDKAGYSKVVVQKSGESKKSVNMNKVLGFVFSVKFSRQLLIWLFCRLTENCGYSGISCEEVPIVSCGPLRYWKFAWKSLEICSIWEAATVYVVQRVLYVDGS